MTVVSVSTVERGWGALADAFLALHQNEEQGGASFCLFVDGRKVIEVATGVAEPATSRPYGLDTVQLVFSCTKGISALIVHMLAERGDLNLSDPVAYYWPEFGQNGKELTTVDDVLAHRAGVPCCDDPLTLADVCDGVTVPRALARQEPLWAPGTGHGYHALTYGFLLAEIVHRATGRSMGDLLQDVIARPNGLDVWLGLPESENHRLAKLVPAPPPSDAESRQRLRRFGPSTIPGRSLTLNGALQLGGNAFSYNTPAVIRAEIPAANAVCSASALAEAYSSLVTDTTGRRLLSRQAVAHAVRPCSEGPDRILGTVTRFGRGFMLPTDEMPMLSPSSFGHPGAGGSLAFADTRYGVGFAYLTSRLSSHIMSDPRAATLAAATRTALKV